jgi:hypothetical protein
VGGASWKGNNLLASPEIKGITLWHSWGYRIRE